MKYFLNSFLILCFLFAVHPAQAKTESKTASKTEKFLTYDVYAGGVHAVQAKLHVHRPSLNKYNLDLSATTLGMLKTLAPWSGSFVTQGDVRPKNIFRSRHHRSQSHWRDDLETKDYKYDSAGKFLSYKVVEEGKDISPETVDTKLTKGTTDILTATYQVMENLKHNKGCTHQARIFDGDRNFEAIFAKVGEENLKKTKYNIYEGPSILCTIEVVPKEGKWRDKPRGWLSIQEQGRKKGTMPTIWFAQLNKNEPYVPVKIRVKTDYGTLFMHLTAQK
jgi:hypothetical protein